MFYMGSSRARNLNPWKNFATRGLFSRCGVGLGCGSIGTQA